MEAEPGQKPVAIVPSGASIEVRRGFYEGLELPIDRDWFVIGRGRGADAVLADATISRAHAAIGFAASEGFFLQDLGSTNGTLLNGERQKRSVLRDAADVRLQSLELGALALGIGAHALDIDRVEPQLHVVDARERQRSRDHGGADGGLLEPRAP